jgi:transcription initiation factor TFIID subunit 7
MLVVGHEISSEDQVTQESLRPEELEWPDGITPPLKDVRKKKWRKRIDLGVSIANCC